MFFGSLWVSCSLEHSAKDLLTTLVPFMGRWFGPPSRSNFAIVQPSLQMGFCREIKIWAVEASGYPTWGPAALWRTSRRRDCSLLFPELGPSLGKQREPLSSFISPICTPSDLWFLPPLHTLNPLSSHCLIFPSHKLWVKNVFWVPKKFCVWPCLSLSLVVCWTNRYL